MSAVWVGLLVALAHLYLWAAESERGPLSDWSDRLYRDSGGVWVLITYTAATIASIWWVAVLCLGVYWVAGGSL